MNENFTFHHIGVATGNFKEAISTYEKLGYGLLNNQIHEDPIQQVRIALMKKEKHPLIELITPLGDKSPVNKVISKNGATPYHTCYEVDNIELAVEELRQLSFIQISDLSPAVAFGGRQISFLFNKSVGIIELLGRA